MVPQCSHEPPFTLSPPIQSPCNKVCTVDGDSGLCIGCFRSIEEVATWAVISPAQRKDIMRTLRAREAQIAPDKRYRWSEF